MEKASRVTEKGRQRRGWNLLKMQWGSAWMHPKQRAAQVQKQLMLHPMTL
jgi:hypothetical protein